MTLVTVRKQNSSCDPCRRSKRRCAFPEGTSGLPASCINCAHLGHNCTFDFVIARRNQKRNKARPYAGFEQRPLLAPAIAGTEKQPLASLALSTDPVDDSSSAIACLAVDGVCDPSFQNVDMSIGTISLQPTYSDKGHNAAIEAPIRQHQHVKPVVASDTGPAIHAAQASNAPRSSSLGLWRGSPIHLLNSNVEAQRVNYALRDVYSYMMHGIAIRYLSFNCNLFASSYKYSFNPDNLEQVDKDCTAQAMMPPGKASDSQATSFTQSLIMAPESFTSQVNSVTMIGVARFLDNFGPLYGNRIDQRSRSQNERALIAVLQAFALQYLPSSESEGSSTRGLEVLSPSNPKTNTSSTSAIQGTTSLQVFTSAWFNAYSQLVATRNCRSFVRLYSVFLFQMTCKPAEAAEIQPYALTPLGLLDEGLYQLEQLQAMLTEYCEQLGYHSIYRFLLQSSMGIARWYAYLRDTIDSVLNERPCLLEDAPLTTLGSFLSGHPPPKWQNESILDKDVPLKSQNAAGDLFRVFRGFIGLRQVLFINTAAIDVHAVKHNITFSLGVFDEFTMTYGPWLDQCVISFDRLSGRSKLSFAFMSLFSNMAMLLLVEQLQQASDMLPKIERRPLLDKAASYQKEAVSSMLALALRIVNVSALDDCNLVNSVQANMHFVSHHANTALVVLGLTKAIEHTIEMNLAAIGRDDRSFCALSNAAGNTDWIASMKPLLTCLLTLESTVSGVITARPALTKLMQQYGDILMDCWSHDEAGVLS